jgi:hypothetical protein
VHGTYAPGSGRETLRVGVIGGLSISVRFARHNASGPAWPQGSWTDSLPNSVTGDGRSSGRGQARRVRGAGATADRLRRPTPMVPQERSRSPLEVSARSGRFGPRPLPPGGERFRELHVLNVARPGTKM